MADFGGKKLRQVVSGFGGNGLGQLLAAVAVTVLVRLFSGPGPVIPAPENDDNEECNGDGETGDVDDGGDGEAPVSGKVFPVTIRWSNISCSLSHKSSKHVSFRLLTYFLNFVNVLYLDKSPID